MVAKIALIFFGIVALCSAAPGFYKGGFGGSHVHHLIHAPLFVKEHVHNFHHHHIQKIAVPIIKKIFVHDHHVPVVHGGWSKGWW